MWWCCLQQPKRSLTADQCKQTAEDGLSVIYHIQEARSTLCVYGSNQNERMNLISLCILKTFVIVWCKCQIIKFQRVSVPGRLGASVRCDGFSLFPCCPSLLLVLLWLPEALTVQSLPCHLHHGLDLWIHIQDTPLALAFLALKHKNSQP